MFVDSHCHLDFPELAPDVPQILDDMARNRVSHALVVAVSKPEWARIRELVAPHDNLFASVGVHPDYPDTEEPTVEDLVQAAADPKIVAIGETGLDYYRGSEPFDWQRERFRVHIRASRQCGLPLIIHTRSAARDTLDIMAQEGADAAGGVMHCFTETWDVAQAAMELGFYISFSGIVTFRNATALQEVACRVPLERMLIETDAPYLAPVPFRGKRNDPSKVPHVAQKIADLRGIALEEVEAHTTANFFKLFSKAATAVST
ncbi:TatD family hydrolase [Yanghanlia caeni]|uniref:TatD family hydrolase n=1 Tax=Yanghanlia caeni TaxID=3064283 RepID=A0ABU1D5R0_9BURK|nr:TatD family hydrolase [Alcaligenaceae bacterium LG-2]